MLPSTLPIPSLGRLGDQQGVCRVVGCVLGPGSPGHRALPRKSAFLEGRACSCQRWQGTRMGAWTPLKTKCHQPTWPGVPTEI